MISVIIPTFNEEKGIRFVLKRIPKSVRGEKVEVIVVDGLSTDATVEIAKKNGAKVISEKRKGKGIAMMTGVRYCKGDKLILMDGDGTYNPAYIPLMIKLLESCNMVVASRYLGKVISSDFTTSAFYKIAFFTMRYINSHFKTTEPLTGFRAIRKSDWKKLNLKSHDFRIELEMEINAVRKNFKIIEIPHERSKRYGKSNLTLSLSDWKKIFGFVRKNQKFLNKKPTIYRLIDYSRMPNK